MLRLDPDALAPGPNGLWYLLVRYRLGKVKPGMLLRVHRRAPGDPDWRFMGDVPASDDLSTFDNVSFAVSPEGALAVAFATYEGGLRVERSTDGGRSWTDLGSPDRPRVPGLRALLPGIGATVRDGMPSVRWIPGGWGLAWEEHVSVPKGLTGSDDHVDTLFSTHGAEGGWAGTVRVNDRRIVVERTDSPLAQAGKSGMQALEDLHRKGRGTGLRYPHLATAASGRIAALWTELRERRIVPVASVSDDDGRTWSAAIALDASERGDAERVRGSLSADGKVLQAICLVWPGESALRSNDGLGLAVAEIVFP
jgi:hypothetical protein